ncbi:MAG TPA: response regulator, partial [Candidatus Polarisedimenticolia bacterium]|nr:response regulator [Candidatus Polarisedimenticolia bacterium]
MMPDRKARVLIVEDDEFLRRQIASYFGGRYEIHQASDRQEALAQVRGGDVDLVLLDMRLPPHTDSIEEGLRTVSEIFAAAPGTLTIAMRGDCDRQTILSAAASGVYYFFTKPLDINELEVIIRRALDRRHLESEIRRLREQLQEKYDFRN